MQKQASKHHKMETDRSMYINNNDHRRGYTHTKVQLLNTVATSSYTVHANTTEITHTSDPPTHAVM